MPDEQPFRLDLDPFAGFEVAVVVDRAVYSAGDTVRVTVSATNHGDRFVEHHYPGWQRFELSVRDAYHRAVATDRVDRSAETPGVDRWLPGQMVLYPVYWGQHEGPVVPAWTHEPPGPRVASGRYRIRVTWLGRVPGFRAEPPEVWSAWFELV